MIPWDSKQVVMLILVIISICGAAFAGNAHAGQYMSHREWVAYEHCEQGHVKSCIHRAAIHQHISYVYMLGISFRESRWNPRVTSSAGAAGLFQMMPRLWSQTPERYKSRYSAMYNSLAAAWVMRHIGIWPWRCC